MNKKIAVIGLGIFGHEIAICLNQQGYSVLAIDNDPEIIENIKNQVTQAVILDSTDENALREVKIEEVPIVINAIGTQNLESSILTTALLHQLQIPRIIARATNKLHGRIQKQVGASEIINPEEEMARRTANRIAHPGFKEILSLADGVCVTEVPLPPSFRDKTLSELNVRQKYNITVIGVQRVTSKPALDASIPETRGQFEARHLLDETRKLILHIDPEKEKLNDDDTLLIVGHEKDINKLTGLG